MAPDRWEDCYNLSWKGVITPESFCHPAKMSRGLLRRILDHAFEQGWVSKGSVICDPFGGIGSTAIEGTYRGLKVICVELEKRFVELSFENMALHARHWTTLGCPQPVILQGDSRKLCELVREAGCVVGSPPFMETKDVGTSEWMAREKAAGRLRSGTRGNATMHHNAVKVHGDTPGQLGVMKAGSVAAVVGSPPYAESPVQQTHMTSNQRGDPANPNYRPSWKKKLAEGYEKTARPYGEAPGQLAALPPGSVASVISSPPYATEQMGGGGQKHDRNIDGMKAGYGKTTGQLGQLPPGSVASVIASPPYESNRLHDGGIDPKQFAEPHRAGGNNQATTMKDYGRAAGQLSNESSGTFWEASKIILEQCYQLLPPSGHAIWVVKAFVRNKKLVDFPGDWRRLCEAVGFRLVCEHQAMLTRTWEELDLFEGSRRKEKKRVSFFRRLAEKKGSPPINWESVQCFTRV